MRYRLIELASMWALALLVVACGGSDDGGPDESELAGTYNGELVIANSDPFVTVTTTLTVSGSGEVSGTTTALPQSASLASKEPSRASSPDRRRPRSIST